jgi:hypothetical protein
VELTRPVVRYLLLAACACVATGSPARAATAAAGAARASSAGAHARAAVAVTAPAVHTSTERLHSRPHAARRHRPRQRRVVAIRPASHEVASLPGPARRNPHRADRRAALPSVLSGRSHPSPSRLGAAQLAAAVDGADLGATERHEPSVNESPSDREGQATSGRGPPPTVAHRPSPRAFASAPSPALDPPPSGTSPPAAPVPAPLPPAAARPGAGLRSPRRLGTDDVAVHPSSPEPARGRSRVRRPEGTTARTDLPSRGESR